MTKQTTNKSKGPSLADQVIQRILQRCELVHTKKKEPFAIMEVNNVRQVHSLHSPSFGEWIASSYYADKKTALSEASLKTVLSTLSGKAVFEGRLIEIHTRIAKTDQGYWLDLCNDHWQVILINSSGWQVMSGPSIPLFRRSDSMQAIPVPLKGGSLNDLWPLINIPREERLLIVAWLLECLRADTPHVVLELVGEQGAAKSSTQNLLRMLIDPNVANLRASPKTVQDVWVGAQNSHLVSFENISHLSHEIQDSACVLATGGAYASRTLYTNTSESIIELRKPIVINGIAACVTAPDLLDRAISLELPPVVNRVQSQEITRRFEAHYPHLVGALLDQFVNALDVLDSVTIANDDKPRMLDFAYLGEAVHQANGLAAGTFIAQYQTMRQKGVQRTIESSPVGLALSIFLDHNTRGWSGRLIELLTILDQYKPLGANNWPRSPKALGDSLRRLSPALRTLGIQCKSSPKQHGTIIWEISPMPTKSSIQCPPSHPSPETEVREEGSSGHGGHSGHENHNLEGLIGGTS
jgi:hypothetical protein